jgi:hypothetical protein
LGNSPKQGRKTDAETKGRRIDFEDDADFDTDFDFGTSDLNIDESVGVPQNLSTDEFMVPTAGQIFTTA